MRRIQTSASADAPARAHNPNDPSTDDHKEKARAIIEAQLARKKGGGQGHGAGHDREGKTAKTKGQFAAPPARPGQRGRRG